MNLNNLLKFITIILLSSFINFSYAFSLKDTENNLHTLDKYKGKWVLVNFWATWCPPCLMEIPDFVELQKKLPHKIAIIGIAMDYKNPKDVINFAKEQKINYPIVLGDRKIASQIGSVTMFPTSYLYNPQGKLVSYQVGILSGKGIESYMKSHEK